MRTLALVAAALLLTTAAYAQDKYRQDTNPSAIPASPAVANPVQTGEGAQNPSKPGSGYQAPAPGSARQAPDAPKGAGVADPSKPGSGYGMGK